MMLGTLVGIWRSWGSRPLSLSTLIGERLSALWLALRPKDALHTCVCFQDVIARCDEINDPVLAGIR